jgi:hypothetical protein
MNDKRKHTNRQQPVHTIQCGDVVAAIHLRQSNCGLQYYDFTLTRTWKSLASGKQARAVTFFENNQKDLCQAITEASTWIRERQRNQTANEPGPSVARVADSFLPGAADSDP